MKRIVFKIALIGGILLAFAITTSGQSEKRGTAQKVVDGTARTTVVIVGTSAKYGWKATKFTAGKVAKPIVVKGIPAVGKFAFKQTGTAAKHSFPVIKKLAITYLKF